VSRWKPFQVRIINRVEGDVNPVAERRFLSGQGVLRQTVDEIVEFVKTGNYPIMSLNEIYAAIMG